MGKIERYNWVVEDEQGQFCPIHKDELVIDHDYQRNLIKNSQVLRLASKWSWAACGAIIVAERESDYYVIDGQHRVAAARKRDDIEAMPCLVFPSKGKAHEARTFITTNTARKVVSAYHKHRAALVSKDEEALSVQKVLDQNGLQLIEKPHAKLQISCISTCVAQYRLSRSGFRFALETVARLCTNADRPVNKKLLEGFFYLRCYQDDARFLKRSLEVGAPALLGSITKSEAFLGKGGAKVSAHGILEEMNKRLKNRFEMPEVRK